MRGNPSCTKGFRTSRSIQWSLLSIVGFLSICLKQTTHFSIYAESGYGSGMGLWCFHYMLNPVNGCTSPEWCYRLMPVGPVFVTQGRTLALPSVHVIDLSFCVCTHYLTILWTYCDIAVAQRCDTKMGFCGLVLCLAYVQWSKRSKLTFKEERSHIRHELEQPHLGLGGSGGGLGGSGGPGRCGCSNSCHHSKVVHLSLCTIASNCNLVIPDVDNIVDLW